MKYFLRPVPTVPLWMACYGDDVCSDANAVCQEGQCSCTDGYFDKAGVCGTFACICFCVDCQQQQLGYSLNIYCTVCASR